MERFFQERFLQNEGGQGLVEYGLIIALVAVAALIGLSAFGEKTAGLVTGVEEHLTFGKTN
ncbi:MAG TPA: Flp family type IVb pilin [Eubacteriales bacterium]|nr:Flp family type IVb pilin [Eubacteriales bacterium]